MDILLTFESGSDVVWSEYDSLEELFETLDDNDVLQEVECDDYDFVGGLFEGFIGLNKETLLDGYDFHDLFSELEDLSVTKLDVIELYSTNFSHMYDELDELIEKTNESYQGEFDSHKDFILSFGDLDVASNLEAYIDFDALFEGEYRHDYWCENDHYFRNL